MRRKTSKHMATKHACYMIDYVKSGHPEKHALWDERRRKLDRETLTTREAEAILGDVADDITTDYDIDPKTGYTDATWVVVSKDIDYEDPYYIEGRDELHGDDPEEVLNEWLGECCARLEKAGCEVTCVEVADGCDPFIFNPDTYFMSELRADFMYDDF